MPSFWPSLVLIHRLSRHSAGSQTLQDPWTQLLKIPAPGPVYCLLVWALLLALSSSAQLAFSLLLKLTEHQLKATLPGTLEPVLNEVLRVLGTVTSSISESGQVTREIFTSCVLIVSSISQRRRLR